MLLLSLYLNVVLMRAVYVGVAGRLGVMNGEAPRLDATGLILRRPFLFCKASPDS